MSATKIPATLQPFTICYSGNFGRAHNIVAVIELIERTRDIERLRYRLVGGGAGTTRLQHYVHVHRITNVAFERYAPRGDLARSLARADVHLVSLNPACEGLIMPSKIYGILAAGRPTLFLGHPAGSVARLIRNADAGLALDIGQPASWRASIESLIADTARIAKMAANAYAAYSEHYTQAISLAAWRDVLTQAPTKVSVVEPRSTPVSGPAAAQGYAFGSARSNGSTD